MTVYFVPWDANQNLLLETERLYEKAGTFNDIEKDDLVAVKLHVGELGNPGYVQPFFVHHIIQKIKDAGGKPFLTDSNTYYLAQRHNAYDHIQTALMNGFNMTPFIAADGLRSENSHTIKTRGILKEIQISGAIAQADAMIVISHCKGHELCGFGGAIKNLAMGCTSREGKLQQHRTVNIEINQTKCIGCATCKTACPNNLPQIINKKAHITSPLCMRCPICKSECPTKAIHFTNQENLCKALASAALGVLETFKPNKISYVNFAKDITQHCDCLPNPGAPIINDVGIFAANSPVSIDAAFLKKINYQQLFNKLSNIDCMTQITEAINIGIPGNPNPTIQQI
ncbi:MAG: DUF362 domain-containing protein [Candidatus Bathyarchaeota archaeon]|nr:DUF362 domain-containing protein [Candidatus Termiticorpusculum sp.]